MDPDLLAEYARSGASDKETQFTDGREFAVEVHVRK